MKKSSASGIEVHGVGSTVRFTHQTGVEAVVTIVVISEGGCVDYDVAY